MRRSPPRTAISDNSVYAEVGYKLVGTRAVARTARRMGIRTPISTNPAMVLGGLKVGVTPLEMADSYLTLAHGGSRVSGTLSAYDGGPVAYTKVKGSGIGDENDTRSEREVPEGVASQATQILQTVVSSGTGKNAATGELRGRQDRHDRELRRCLVRRLQRHDDRGRLGRLPDRRQGDGDRVPR